MIYDVVQPSKPSSFEGMTVSNIVTRAMWWANASPGSLIINCKASKKCFFDTKRKHKLIAVFCVDLSFVQACDPAAAGGSVSAAAPLHRLPEGTNWYQILLWAVSCHSFAKRKIVTESFTWMVRVLKVWRASGHSDIYVQDSRFKTT